VDPQVFKTAAEFAFPANFLTHNFISSYSILPDCPQTHEAWDLVPVRSLTHHGAVSPLSADS
jgi:hypothetical protein